MTDVHFTDCDGQELVGLRTEQVELLVAPGLGAKVVRLSDRTRGRDWMWSATPARPFEPAAAAAPFDDSQLVGMDECLPTVAPCTFEGVQLPDHGEVWNIAWQLDRAALEAERIVRTSVTLQTLPLRFERTIQLQNDEVLFRYTLRNLADRPTRFAWAMHPLFAMRAGDRMELHGVQTEARVDSAGGLASLQAGQRVPWRQPVPGASMPDLLAGGSEQSLKLYVAAEEGAGFEVRNDDGTCLQGSFGPVAQLSYLGLWVSRGGWNGYEHFAIEPTNVERDHLDRVPADAASELAPNESREWWVRWKLGC